MVDRTPNIKGDNNMNTTKTIIVGIAAGAVFAGAATILAPLVHADEGTFVDQLYVHDVTVTSASISLGHTICATLSREGYDGVTDAARAMVASGMSTRDAAGFVIISSNELCPSTIPVISAWMANN